MNSNYPSRPTFVIEECRVDDQRWLFCEFCDTKAEALRLVEAWQENADAIGRGHEIFFRVTEVLFDSLLSEEIRLGLLEGNKPAFDLWQDAIKAHDAIADLIHAVKAEREARAAVARERAQLASGEITPEDLHPGADAPDGISTSQRHIEAVQRVARAIVRRARA